jgi:hypothetical protein
VLLVTASAVPAFAADDTTPPVGTLSISSYAWQTEIVGLNVSATDTESAVATVEISSDGVTWASYPYAPTVDWDPFDPAAGGAPGIGSRTVRARWTDASGNTSAPVSTRLYIGMYGALEFPSPAITGQAFTIRPIYPVGFVPNTSDPCSWELMWGDTAALRDGDYNATFGSLFTSGLSTRGFCGPWTFTLPYTDVRQFQVLFNGQIFGISDEPWGKRAMIYPTVGSTNRRITASNIPLVHVLPNKFGPLTLGESITYTAYPIGLTLRSDDTWMAFYPGDPIGPRYKLQYGGSMLTFTPPTTGTWLVTWNGIHHPGLALNATYDPPVRRADTYRPNTTAPVAKIGVGTAGPTVPVALTWSGTDTGWGLKGYQLQRSIDGGTWTGVALPTAMTTTITQQLSPGHSARYRVRATDKAGNVGYWDYGPTFTPRLLSDSDARVTYSWQWATEADPTANGASLHTASAVGAAARLAFTGRDLAWVAETGPGKGRAKVYLDGVLKATVDLYAASDTPRRIVFRWHWSSAGSHVIRIVVEGTLGRPAVTIDGIAVTT